MGKIFEEKALEDDQLLYSLEQDILMFNGEISEEFNSINGDDFDDDDESDVSGSHDQKDRTNYWETQNSMLQEILSHNSLIGTKIRREVKKALEMTKDTSLCHCFCPKPSSNRCTSCLRRAIVNHLCDHGYNAAICTSNWKSSRKVPGGSHEFIDVLIKGPRGKETRFLIELEFRAEFDMAKACDEYRKLINHLPKVYIGKPEHLNAVIRIVCDAAKKSTEESKIYMGPWRKRSFMQMKWLGSYRRWSSDQSPLESISSSIQMHFPSFNFSSRFFGSTTVKVT